MRQITIQGLQFDVDDKYSEGHVATANEASALNQVRAENLRNNFADTVKKAKIAGAKGTSTDEPSAEAVEAYVFTDEDKASLASTFAEVLGKYEFGAKGGGVRITDPVQREALRIATETVHTAIKTKHGKLDAVPKDNIKALIEGFAAKEETQALAAANVAAAKALGDSLGLDI